MQSALRTVPSGRRGHVHKAIFPSFLSPSPLCLAPLRLDSPGMMHIMDHDKVTETLNRLKEDEGLECSLSYDGLRIPVTLS